MRRTLLCLIWEAVMTEQRRNVYLVSIQVPSEPSGSATQVQVSIDPITAGSAPEQPGRTVLMSV